MGSIFGRFAPRGTIIVNRGLIAAPDWMLTDLTADGDPHLLDCSAIVPAGASHIWFKALIASTTPGANLVIMPPIPASNLNCIFLQTTSALFDAVMDTFVETDALRQVYYQLDGADWDIVMLAIRGWLK